MGKSFRRKSRKVSFPAMIWALLQSEMRLRELWLLFFFGRSVLLVVLLSEVVCVLLTVFYLSGNIADVPSSSWLSWGKTGISSYETIREWNLVNKRKLHSNTKVKYFVSSRRKQIT